MKNLIILILILTTTLFTGCGTSPYSYNDGYIKYQKAKISEEDKQKVLAYINDEKAKYDTRENLITREITAWNYHTDTVGATYHDVLQSFHYANALLDTGIKENIETALMTIDKKPSHCRIPTRNPRPAVYGHTLRRNL